MTDQRQSLVPRSPSNRRFFDRMVAWGWVPGKGDGDYVSMLTPPIVTPSKTVKVRAPTHHNGNSTKAILDVYKATTAGDAELFWQGPSEMWLQMLEQHRQDAERQRTEKQAAEEVKAAQRVEKLKQQPIEKRKDIIVPEQPTTTVPDETALDDAIELALDLLLPGGFKASHLRVIAPWMESTKAMVRAVAG
jgi:hypothetical protein